MSKKLNQPEEVEVAEVIGQVVTDAGALTHEEIHIISMAPDYNQSKVKQEIVRKWKMAKGVQ